MMPVRRMIATSGKRSLISGSVSPLCHWALDDEIITGSCSAFVTRARPTTLLLNSAAVLVSRVLAISPIW
jgi:hypothetical protein